MYKNKNKNFWKNIKPLFSDKSPKDKTITIVHENEVYSDDKEVSELLNKFFKDAVTNLQITENRFLLVDVSSHFILICISLKLSFHIKKYCPEIMRN